jgi:Tfp pilus assembly protein PilO
MLPASNVTLGARRDPRRAVGYTLGVLAAANLVAAYFVYAPPGGSAEDLESQLSTMQVQVQRETAGIAQLRALVKKVQTTRSEQDRFVARYFMDRRTASSTILTELGSAARAAGLTPKEHAFVFEPIEGSDVFSMMSISANYEGKYADLMRFLRSLDQSERFLIIEDVAAAPQPQNNMLTARFKINAFVRESDASASAPTPAPVSASASPRASNFAAGGPRL